MIKTLNCRDAESQRVTGEYGGMRNIATFRIAIL
jgi:hypothetical protein